MKTTRLEAYSDAVIAIVITIMVLELRPPAGPQPADLLPLLPTVLSYLLSFLLLSIYWVNHHHLLAATRQVNGRIIWANVHLLFWLSLVPFTTSWLSEYPGQSWPTAVYAINHMLGAIAWALLVFSIIDQEGEDSPLTRVLNSNAKGNFSITLYPIAIGAAFINANISYAVFVFIALIWLIPDRRIEAALPTRKEP
jgi:uncharacterized membrane protein